MSEIHCIPCGHPLDGDADAWPKKCSGCGEFNYNSPKPVVAVIAYAQGDTGGAGPVIIKRGIEPYKGTWAFPGGYIDHKEPWQKAAIREFQEEVGITLEARFLMLIEVVVTESNFCVMFVGYKGPGISPEDWADHDLSSCINDRGDQEILDIAIAQQGQTLGVPSHQWLWERLSLL